MSNKVGIENLSNGINGISLFALRAGRFNLKEGKGMKANPIGYCERKKRGTRPPDPLRIGLESVRIFLAALFLLSGMPGLDERRRSGQLQHA